MRPAPRRASRGRPRSRIHWDKLGRVVLVLVLFAILVSYVGPTLKFVGSWRDAGAQRAELRSLQQQNTRLRERAATLGESAAAERAARKLGMVSIGERSYVIRGLGD
jgi:cell division protein FtsB